MFPTAHQTRRRKAGNLIKQELKKMSKDTTEKPKQKFKAVITAYRHVIVEAESQEEAMDIVANQCTSFDWEIEEYQILKEPLTEDQVKTALRHGCKMIDQW